MAAVQSFGSRFGDRSLGEHAARHPAASGDLTMPLAEVAPGRPVFAVVNHGRWIVECPDPACAGAEFARLDDRVFFCCECRNQAAGHKLLRVIVPADSGELERLLEGRPGDAQNWRPGETADQLAAENGRH